MQLPGYFILLSMFMMQSSVAQLVYPQTKKIDHSDNYHGTAVADPYRWLENDTSAETKEWVEAQNKFTFGYLENIPFREQMKFIKFLKSACRMQISGYVSSVIFSGVDRLPASTG